MVDCGIGVQTPPGTVILSLPYREEFVPSGSPSELRLDVLPPSVLRWRLSFSVLVLCEEQDDGFWAMHESCIKAEV